MKKFIAKNVNFQNHLMTYIIVKILKPSWLTKEISITKKLQNNNGVEI